MGKKPNKKNTSLAIGQLAPNSISVTTPDGVTIVVPANKQENAFLNMLMAAQLRTTVQKTIEKFKADEVTLTPKELRDLAGAARDIAAFSAEIYMNSDPIGREEKPAEVASTDIQFDALSTPPVVKDDGKPKEGNPPEADSSGPVPGISPEATA